jgi:hypothetical protein
MLRHEYRVISPWNLKKNPREPWLDVQLNAAMIEAGASL